MSQDTYGDYDDDIDTIEPTEETALDDLIEVAGVESLPEDKPVEPEKESYSKKVQKRIDKLAYERNVAREEAASLAARLSELEKHKSETDNASLEQKRQEILRQKTEAFEEGDFEKAALLDDELLDIKVAQRTRPQPVQQQPEPVVTNEKPAAIASWEEKNKWIFEQSPKAEFAKKAYVDLLNSGFDANDPDTLAELDNIVSQKFKPQRRETPPSPGAVDRGQVIGDDEKQGFSSRDKSDMEDFGLNPNDPKQRAMWIKNKRSVSARG